MAEWDFHRAAACPPSTRGNTSQSPPEALFIPFVLPRNVGRVHGCGELG